MLLYYLFWMFMSFTKHFYIIFGTNLLTGAQIVVFLPISVFWRKRNMKRSPNGMKPSGAIFLEQTWSRGLGVEVKKQGRRSRGCSPRPLGLGVPPPSWAPRASTDLLLPPIYTHVPRKHRKRPWKTISTAVTFYIREIPSWSLRRCSTGGGIDHGVLLHQHHSPSDELWVVYHRPSGP